MKEVPSLSYLNKLTEGDGQFMLKLVDIIKKEFPAEKEHYNDAVKDGNNEKIAQCIHKLKHKFCLLSYEQGYETAVAHEEGVKIDNHDKTNEFQGALNTLEQFILQL